MNDNRLDDWIKNARAVQAKLVEINLRKRGKIISYQDTKPMDTDKAYIINYWTYDKVQEDKWLSKNMF